VVAQGNTADGPFSGIPFWERRLNEGFRPTAIGGSDNHKPDADRHEHAAIGAPTTVVLAQALSERAILDAIRAGHVFIDVEGTANRVLELSGECGVARAIMGDALAVPKGGTAEFTLRVRGLKGAQVDVILDGAHGALLPDTIVANDDASFRFAFKGDGARHWLRADVRSADGTRTLMIGNPIYVR
jgi:hypothetical protein